MPDLCFALKTFPGGEWKLGGGLPGFQPALLGGGGGVTGGTGMVGGEERAIARLVNRQSMNTPCFLSKALGRKVQARTTPFRTAMNAGDTLGTVNSGPLLALGYSNQLYGLNGKMQHYRRDGIHDGQAGFSGNQKYVYDSSDYIRFKAQRAKLKTYNDSSFGGAGAGKGGIGRMAVTVSRAIGPCCAGRGSARETDVDCVTDDDLARAEKELQAHFDETSKAIKDLDCDTGDCATEDDVAKAGKELQLHFDATEKAIKDMNHCDTGDCATEDDVAKAGKDMQAQFDAAEKAIKDMNHCDTGDCATEDDVAKAGKDMHAQFDAAEKAIKDMNHCDT